MDPTLQAVEQSMLQRGLTVRHQPISEIQESELDVITVNIYTKLTALFKTLSVGEHPGVTKDRLIIFSPDDVRKALDTATASMAELYLTLGLAIEPGPNPFKPTPPVDLE